VSFRPSALPQIYPRTHPCVYSWTCPRVYPWIRCDSNRGRYGPGEAAHLNEGDLRPRKAQSLHAPGLTSQLDSGKPPLYTVNR